MDLIQKGNYVRTKKGIIKKIKTANNSKLCTRYSIRSYIMKHKTKNVPDYRFLINGHIELCDVANVSANALELLEVGDIAVLDINGDKEILIVETEAHLQSIKENVVDGLCKLSKIITRERLEEVGFECEQE